MTSTGRLSSVRSTRELIRIAALRNCEGASCLAEQELEEAVAKFAVAYHCIGQAIARDAEGESDDEVFEEENDAIPIESVEKYPFILDTTEVAWYAASSIPEAEQNRGFSASGCEDLPSRFVAKEAMVFHPENASDPEETPFFAAVIMFNLALTFHENGRLPSILGTTVSSSQRDCLFRGLNCYTHCLRLLKEGNYNHSTTSIPANRIVEAHLLIASLNNKAQILFFLGDYWGAFWVLQELGSVLANTAGDPPGFQAAEVRGLEATMELLNTPEMTAVQNDVMASMAVVAGSASDPRSAGQDRADA